jgi:predicted acyltransferase
MIYMLRCRHEGLGEDDTVARPAGRLRSLDVFRGATVASMIFVNTAGALENAYAPLRHATWNGWTFADTIFPFFLWIMGVALTLSTAVRAARGDRQSSLLRHAARRTILLFLGGVFLSVFSFPDRHFPYFVIRDHLQLTGVLQKIAVCYLVAFLIVMWTGWRVVILWVLGLNFVYMGFLFLFPVPGCSAGSLTMECNFPRYLDQSLLGGYLWGVPNVQDPDGLGAILPAISTVLCGVLAGHLLRIASVPRLRIYRLITLGVLLVFAAMLISVWIPVNKPLWTTSYALLMAGLASICFAACYWIVDVLRWGSRFKALEILGMNALTAFALSVLLAHVPKVHFFGRSFYQDVCRQVASAPNASLLYSITYLVAIYLIVLFMYRRRFSLSI